MVYSGKSIYEWMWRVPPFSEPPHVETEPFSFLKTWHAAIRPDGCGRHLISPLSFDPSFHHEEVTFSPWMTSVKSVFTQLRCISVSKTFLSNFWEIPGFPYIFQRFEVTHLPALWRSGTPPGAAVSSPCDRQSGTRRGGRCPEPRAGLRHARGWEKGGSEPLRSRKITNGSCYLHFCLCVCVIIGGIWGIFGCWNSLM